MCGFAGVLAKSENGKPWWPATTKAAQSLQHRGPDAFGFLQKGDVAFGHCRLSIIDPGAPANQPMEEDGIAIVYNGEIFNYKILRNALTDRGEHFRTSSDTEVLLKLYRLHGTGMFPMLNGFFALALYDSMENKLVLARDRFGEKPLLYHENEDVLVFASGMKALLQWPVPRRLDHNSLVEYLELNYIPAPHTILTSVKKLLPGHLLEWNGTTTRISKWYELPFVSQSLSYRQAQVQLFHHMRSAVQLRLEGDVPVGAFLSGGIDSTIVAGLAALQVKSLPTFSLGYAGDPFFDETRFAKIAARHFQTEHTSFRLTGKELAAGAEELLEFPDEPFADSSAIAFFQLSKRTHAFVKAVLSGDGADEFFGGYLKHLAEFRLRTFPAFSKALSLLTPWVKGMAASRNSWFSNRVRQFRRFEAGRRLTPEARYKLWCSISDRPSADSLMLHPYDEAEYEKRWLTHTSLIRSGGDMNEVLRNDVHLVLPNDMLVKSDSMSMAHALEVRSPFLDVEVAEFAASLPAKYKVNLGRRKKILYDTFRPLLPGEIFRRRKQGFEVPLHSLLTQELKSLVLESLSPAHLEEQQLFAADAVHLLLQELFSNNPGDSAARVWGLLVFQQWWKRWMQ